GSASETPGSIASTRSPRRPQHRRATPSQLRLCHEDRGDGGQQHRQGLVAGFAGTAAMTISSTLEARLRGRAPSSAPARATAKVLGIASFEDGIAQARFNDLSHWGYGTGWGRVRGLLAAAGRPPPEATPA